MLSGVALFCLWRSFHASTDFTWPLALYPTPQALLPRNVSAFRYTWILVDVESFSGAALWKITALISLFAQNEAISVLSQRLLLSICRYSPLVVLIIRPICAANCLIILSRLVIANYPLLHSRAKHWLPIDLRSLYHHAFRKVCTSERPSQLCIRFAMLLVGVLPQPTLTLPDRATSSANWSCHLLWYHHRCPLINFHIEIAIRPLLRPVLTVNSIACVFLHLVPWHYWELWLDTLWRLHKHLLA